MEQKTSKISHFSLFSKALFISNIKRFFFIILVHFGALVMGLILPLYVSFPQRLLDYDLNNLKAIDRFFLLGMLRGTESLLGAAPYYMVACFVAVSAVFSYMYFQKSTFMMHAFPITRASMFFTNIITALVMIIVPELIACLMALPVVSGFGNDAITDLLSFFAIGLLNIICFTGISVFVVMCTGAIVAAPILYVILNFLLVGLEGIVKTLVSPFVYGYANWNITEELSPVIKATALLEDARNIYAYDDVTNYYDNPVLGADSGYFIIMTVLGLVFIALGYLIYRAKQVESAGDLLPIRWTRPVFRWGLSFCISSLLALFIVELFNLNNQRPGYEVSVLMAYIVSFIIGIAVFFVTQMIIERNIHVFKKKLFAESLLMSVCFSVFALCLFFDVAGIEDKIPDADEVSYLYLDTNDLVLTFTGDEVGDYIDLQKLILEKKDELRFTHYYSGADIGDEDIYYGNIGFRYVLKDGRSIKRTYGFESKRNETEGFETMVEIENTVNRPENIAQYFYKENEEGLEADLRKTEPYLVEFYKEYYVPDTRAVTDEFYDPDGTYEEKFYTFNSKEQVEKLYEAAKKDIEEGNIKLVTYTQHWERPKEEDFIGTMHFTFTVKDSKDYNNITSYISVTNECNNLKAVWEEMKGSI